MVRPIQRGKGGLRKLPKLRRVGFLQRDNGSKEANVLGLVGYEEDLQGRVVYGHGHGSRWCVTKRQWKDRFVMSSPARGVRPSHSRGEADFAVELSTVVGEHGIVDISCLGEEHHQLLNGVMVKIMIVENRTVWIEQHLLKSDSATDIDVVTAPMGREAFTALANHFEPFEQAFDRVAQRPKLGGVGCTSPRGLVEYEAGSHESRRRLAESRRLRAAKAARSIWV